MRMPKLPLLLAAVCFGAVLAAGFRLQAHMTATVAVLTAAHDLPTQHRITAADLKLAQVAPALVPPGALTHPSAAVGQYTRLPLLNGDVVRADKLTATAPATALSDQLPPNMRALSIGVVPSQVLGGLLRPGDRVDLLAALKAKPGQAATTDTLLQGVQVLDIRNQGALPARPISSDNTLSDNTSVTSAFAGRAANGTLTSLGAGPVPATVLLAVSPDQASSVVAAIASGKTLYLTLVGTQPTGDNQ